MTEKTFIIQFGPVQNQTCSLQVQVGERQAQGVFHLPWTEAEFAPLVAGFEINESLSQDAGDPKRPRAVGAALFQALFADPSVHELFARHLGDGTRSFRLLLSFDHEATGFQTLYRYPWEMLFDPQNEQGFFAVSQIAVVRRVHTKRESRRPTWSAAQQLRVLVAVSNPFTEYAVAGADEAARLGQVLKQQGVYVKVLPAATPALLQAALEEREYDIVHLAAHGDCGELLFEDGAGGLTRVSSEMFSQLLFQAPSLRLVFLNSCFSSANRREGGIRPHAPMLGVAPDLLRKGVPTIVGMQFRINDDDALLLSETFYGCLARGRRLDEAMHAVRRSLYSKNLHHSAWAAAVVLSRQEDHVVFSPTKTEGRAQAVAEQAALGRWLPTKELASRFEDVWRLRKRLCLGRDQKTGREVLLRLIEPGPEWTKQAVDDLVTALECRARQLDDVRHINLARVQDWGRAGNVFYLVFESFAAKPLHHWLGAGRELSEFFVLDVMEQLGAALDTLHRRRLVHGHLAEAIWVHTSQEQRCSVRLLGLFDDVIQRQVKPEPVGQPFEVRRFDDMVAFGKICHLLLTGNEAVIEASGRPTTTARAPVDFGSYKKIFDQVFHAESGERALASHVAGEFAEVVNRRSLPRGYCYVMNAETQPEGAVPAVTQSAAAVAVASPTPSAVALRTGSAADNAAPSLRQRPLLAATVALMILLSAGGGVYAYRGVLFEQIKDAGPIPLPVPSPVEPYFRYPDFPADLPDTPGYLVFASWTREGETAQLDAGLKDEIQIMLAKQGVAIHESMWMDAFLDQPSAFEKLVKQPYQFRTAELKTPARLVLVETKYRSVKREYFREYTAETTVTLVDAGSGRKLATKTVKVEPEKTGFEDRFSDLLKQKIAPAVAKTMANELH